MRTPRLLVTTPFNAEITPELKALPFPHSSLQACVVIPARDESERIEHTLDALANQVRADGTAFDCTHYEIILGCNNCSDSTAQKARTWAQRNPQIHLHVVEMISQGTQANVGWARRMLMNSAYARLAKLPEGDEPRVICSTDADTCVSQNWLSATLMELVAGAEAVGGRIYVERGSDSLTRRTYLRDTAYRLMATRLESVLDPHAYDPRPHHFQYFGASLALTPEAYALVGGLPQAACLEDVALERELRHRDIAIRHSPHVMVMTSARASGRVQTGLSTQLQEWERLGPQKWLVPSGGEIAARAQARRQLRGLFCALNEDPEDDTWNELARFLLIPVPELQSRARRANYFGILWDEVWEAAWSNEALRERWQPVPVEAAIHELRMMLCRVQEK